jgi:two-component system, OmpR family, alkaline phosphatase synthesis response regulator PhoP
MPTILIVDDNEKIVSVLAEYVRAEGYEAITAADGNAALDIVAARRPDLALVDIMLPGVDGLELTRQFGAQGIPVILVTARVDEVDRLVGLGLGADDYVSKPFSPREVIARVKAVLRRCERHADESPVLSVGDISIDRDRRQVLVRGRDAELTRTEFDILATMASHPGRVYSRLQLLEAASNDAFEGYERTVDAHVKNIRRKLGEDPRHPRHVHTVIGVGYKLEA